MTEGFQKPLPVNVVVSFAGITPSAFALMQIANAASSMNVDSFSTYVIVVPCIAMVACSILITITASEIGRQLYLTVVGVCFVCGIVSMVVTSGWFSDPSISAQLLSNSPEGTSITPPLQNPLIVLRNLAAYIVAPTIGCIAGAWLGSRLHPVKSSKVNNQKGRRK
ncbi:MAG: hypothetical protein IJ087_05115 [Eggerthellaceae bacterium]|nr:hypothetical protein [Eggerthellaceae bacterium]